MRLYLFKGECLDDLKSNIKKNRKKYIDNTLPWLDEYFGVEKYRIPTNIEVEAPKLIKSSNNKDYDLENSIALFVKITDRQPHRHAQTAAA